MVNVLTGNSEELQEAFADGELDFLLTLERPPTRHHPPGTRSRVVGSRPLVLLVRKDSGISRADHFWSQKQIAERLAAPRPDHPVVQALQTGLNQGGIAWPTQIVTDSLSNVLPFVAAGMGVGVTLDFPANTQHSQVRVLPIQGFARVNIACHWRTPETPQIRTALRIATEQLKAAGKAGTTPPQ